ncbi:hypothetical protein SUGI_0601470 [Cryptomeria japonica]|uniref:uncharacterized protein LOC131033354 n=1 Tax=Cryptomeria japonica TaxID=3369 RepID=UPI002414C628|nr:uncharacterized protein LOC131033354 [Cryptomeria japonica]GLJ30396.1 hypothetical protein SUGI_0601470 [Cryptomeria japonica]
MAPDTDGIVMEAANPERSGSSEDVCKEAARTIQRAVSDVSAELSRKQQLNSNPQPEAGQVQCECCGLWEECTPTYICRVRENFCGRWICGLCAEAVKVESDRMGGSLTMEDALKAHVTLCQSFNQIARRNPALHMADALRTLLKKSKPFSSSSSLRPHNITRSSSCMPAITRDLP